MARVLPEAPAGPVSVEDYDATLRPMYAWIDATAQGRVEQRGHDSMQVNVWRDLTASGGGRRVRRAALRIAFQVTVAALNRFVRIGPLQADVSAAGLRRSGLIGIGTVLERLGVSAPYVLFGHTHRAGPFASDAAAEWTAPTGSSMINAGSWVEEPSFLGADASSSPYRAGFCVIVEDSDPTRPPVLRNLLD
jgi:hypothetical protein